MMFGAMELEALPYFSPEQRHRNEYKHGYYSLAVPVFWVTKGEK